MHPDGGITDVIPKSQATEGETWHEEVQLGWITAITGNEQMVIVDGNNVMGQRVGWHRNKSAAQQRLIDEVEHIAQSQDEPHILVFDAKPKSTVPDKRSRTLLTVRYARRGSSADELILELVYLHSPHSEVSVVTSDRALTRQIHVLGAKVMRSGAFRQMLDKEE